MSADIAVVLTCHELGRWLEEAVDSVLGQSWGAAEIVVVDDGSEEPLTRHVLARLARPRTRVERIAHAGVGAARNHGIRITRAPLIACLDADDLLEPDYIRATASRLVAEPALGFVTTALRAFEGADYVWLPEHASPVDILVRGGPHSATLFRRDLFERVGGFSETIPGHELTDFFLSAWAAGFRGACLEQPLLRHRVRAGSQYRRVLRPETRDVVLRMLYERHRALLEPAWHDLLLARERFLLEQRRHQRWLLERRERLERELGEQRAERERLAAAIRALGGEPLELGDLRRTAPLSPQWGIERGRPLDRPWIEDFLAANRADIRGRVLEVKDGHYARHFGGPAVTELDILDVSPANVAATVVADLARPLPLPDGRYDCILLTQTLGLIADPRNAVRELHRLLAPGGVLLATAPALGRVSPEDRGSEGDYWRFTEAGLRALLDDAFLPGCVEVTAHGNALAGAAFLQGLAAEELSEAERAVRDPWLPVVVTARAVRPASVEGGAAAAAVVLTWHRVGEAGCGALATERFREQIDLLLRRFRVLPLGEVARAARGGTLPRGAIALTFDDGTPDHLAIVSPLLVERGLPATFFVTTAGIEHAEPPVWMRPQMDPELAARVYAAGPAEREALERELRLRTAPPVGRTRLGPGELQELAARPGHELGSHTASHLALSLHPGAAREEIVAAREALHALTGRPPAHLAWPYGEHTRPCLDAAREAGHDAAFSVVPAAVRAGQDPFALPRLEVGDESTDDLARRIEALLG